MKGPATGEKHRRGTAPGAIPVLAFDYMFLTENCEIIERDDLTEEVKASATKVLVAKDCHVFVIASPFPKSRFRLISFDRK